METSIKTFVEAGGKTENLQKEKDITEAEKVKEQNLIDRKNIIEKIKELIDNQDKQGNFHEIFDEFKELQHRWKEIARIPQNATNGLWKEYHYCCQQFYDWIKLNDMMRNYDFKKNLELKQELCEVVERLDKELNIVSAFHQLQRFCYKWREVGPVSFEYRKDIWERFRQAVSVINKKYQQHFENLKESEQKTWKKKCSL